MFNSNWFTGMLKKIEEHKIAYMFLLATFLTLFGCGLLVAGFIVPPLGVISNSVLISVGEVFTFAGSVLGINATYKSKLDENINKLNKP